MPLVVPAHVPTQDSCTRLCFILLPRLSAVSSASANASSACTNSEISEGEHCRPQSKHPQFFCSADRSPPSPCGHTLPLWQSFDRQRKARQRSGKMVHARQVQTNCSGRFVTVVGVGMVVVAVMTTHQ